MPTELRDGVWWYEATGVNAYLVADDEGLTVIDAGTPFDAARVEAAIGQAGYDRTDVTRILVTHYDIDHVGAIGKLGVDAPVYVGEADADFLIGAARPGVTGLKPALQTVLGPLIPDVDADRVHPVTDGDRIGGFTVHHTPGHTPGHVAYVHEGREVGLLGDAVLERDGQLRASPWYLSYDAARAKESVVSVSHEAASFETLAMGHGTPFEAAGSETLAALAESP
jgi:glyoxylase-like metal-dependent hydrolase (beta-lactamase superfamily II)